MERKEYIFKEVDGVSIDADVYFRKDQSTKSPIGQLLAGNPFQLFQTSPDLMNSLAFPRWELHCRLQGDAPAIP